MEKEDKAKVGLMLGNGDSENTNIATSQSPLVPKTDFSDFAILLRFFKFGARVHYAAFEKEFSSKSRLFPYKIVGKSSLLERPAALDLQAYLLLITDLDNDVACMRVLNEPPRRLGDSFVEHLKVYKNILTKEKGRKVGFIETMLNLVPEYGDIVKALDDSKDINGEEKYDNLEEKYDNLETTLDEEASENFTPTPARKLPKKTPKKKKINFAQWKKVEFMTPMYTNGVARFLKVIMDARKKCEDGFFKKGDDNSEEDETENSNQHDSKNKIRPFNVGDLVEFIVIDTDYKKLSSHVTKGNKNEPGKKKKDEESDSSESDDSENSDESTSETDAKGKKSEDKNEKKDAAFYQQKKFSKLIDQLIEHAKDNSPEAFDGDENEENSTKSNERNSKTINISFEKSCELISEYLTTVKLDDDRKGDAKDSTKKNKSKFPDLSGKIAVSTIHRAKGLEWKHVFVVNVNEDFLPGIYREDPDEEARKKQKEGDNHNNNDKNTFMKNGRAKKRKPTWPTADKLNAFIEEERRLAHVAVTRGKERVYLSFVDDLGATDQFGNAQAAERSSFIPEDFLNGLNENVEFTDFTSNRSGSNGRNQGFDYDDFYSNAREAAGGYYKGFGQQNNRNADKNFGFNNQEPEPTVPFISMRRNRAEYLKVKPSISKMDLEVIEERGFLILPKGADLQKAYRKLALKLHPDKAAEGKQLEMTEKFKAMKNAYDEIVNALNRFNEMKYDS